jgi:hypothetical protein
MVNRTIQQKILKRKRRNRYAKFSGSTVKYAKGDRTKEISYLEHIDDDKVTVKTKTVYVGVESFSKQVINTGRGPDRARMQSYYDHVPTSFEPRTLAEVLGLVKDPRYATVWWETPATNRINLFVDPSNRLDLYTHGGKSFFVELDFVRKIIKRSRDYSSISTALQRLRLRSILWVEQLPMVG